MKNILVLIDLSPRSEQVARQAIKIAQTVQANVLLCDVLNAPLNKAILFDENEYFEDEYYTNAQDLADSLIARQSHIQPEWGTIDCMRISDLDAEKIRSITIEKNIWMIVTGVQYLTELSPNAPDNYMRQIIDDAICPVLVIPDGANVTFLDRIAYLTDLRYCDAKVVSYLTTFNGPVFVTHISANGIPDMADSYAQELLSDGIAIQVNYNKLFLRNIKGKNRKTDLENVVHTTDIKAITIVNKKHQMLDQFIQTDTGKQRMYHQLPLLIIPYMNRHNW